MNQNNSATKQALVTRQHNTTQIADVPGMDGEVLPLTRFKRITCVRRLRCKFFYLINASFNCRAHTHTRIYGSKILLLWQVHFVARVDTVYRRKLTECVVMMRSTTIIKAFCLSLLLSFIFIYNLHGSYSTPAGNKRAKCRCQAHVLSSFIHSFIDRIKFDPFERQQ